MYRFNIRYTSDYEENIEVTEYQMFDGYVHMFFKDKTEKIYPLADIKVITIDKL